MHNQQSILYPAMHTFGKWLDNSQQNEPLNLSPDSSAQGNMNLNVAQTTFSSDSDLLQGFVANQNSNPDSEEKIWSQVPSRIDPQSGGYFRQQPSQEVEEQSLGQAGATELFSAAAYLSRHWTNLGLSLFPETPSELNSLLSTQTPTGTFSLGFPFNLAPPPFSQEYNVKWPTQPDRLAFHVASMEGDSVSADMTLVARDGKKFPAHRIVLASVSDFLSSTLKNISQDDNVILVVPRPARCVAAILKFCYHGYVVVSDSDIKDVLEIADEYQIRGLRRGCWSSLATNSPLPVNSLIKSTPNLQKNFPGDVAHSSTSSSISPRSPKTSKIADQPEDERTNPYKQASKRLKSEAEDLKIQEESLIFPPSTDESPSEEIPAHPPSVTQQTPPPPKQGTASSGLSISYRPSIIPQYINPSSRILLWKFLLDLLHDPAYSPDVITWIDRQAGKFRIVDSDKVAALWGEARKNSHMTYEKMSRGLRTYYKKGLLSHADGTKLIYRFNMQDETIQHQLNFYRLLSRVSPSIDDVTNSEQRETLDLIDTESYPQTVSDDAPQAGEDLNLLAPIQHS